MHIIHRTFGAAILRAPDDAAASGPLNVDGATAAILALSATPEPEPSDPEPETDPTPEPESAETSDPESGDPQPEPEDQPADPEAAETPSPEEPADKDEPAQPAIDPPHFWSAEDKAAFKDLPRQLQEKVLAYEKNRDTATSRAIQQAREAEQQAQDAKKAAETEASAIAEFKARVDKQIPDAESQFKATWGDNPDWVAIQNACIQQASQQVPAEQVAAQATLLYQNTRAAYDADVQRLQGLRDAKQQAETLERDSKAKATQAEQARKAAWVSEQVAALKTVSPELADPKQGPARIKAVGEFLTGLGFAPAQLDDAGAAELALAYDAMRYRQAQAQQQRAASQPKPKAPPAPAKPTVKPTAAPAQVSTPQRAAQETKNRFAQKPSIDNAVAAILARSGQKG